MSTCWWRSTVGCLRGVQGVSRTCLPKPHHHHYHNLQIHDLSSWRSSLLSAEHTRGQSVPVSAQQLLSLQRVFCVLFEWLPAQQDAVQAQGGHEGRQRQSQDEKTEKGWLSFKSRRRPSIQCRFRLSPIAFHRSGRQALDQQAEKAWLSCKPRRWSSFIQCRRWLSFIEGHRSGGDR